MLGKLSCAVALACAVTGCESAEEGHSLTLRAELHQENGELAFLSPAISINRVPTSEIVGKPYMIGTYPAGFSPGNDPPIESYWGEVPPELVIEHETTSTLADGPYDMVLVVYVHTEITDEIRALPLNEAPPATGGDLATFTIDTSVIRPGDPMFPAGVVRLNVEGADASITVANRTPMDLQDSEQLTEAVTNTIMVIQ